MPPMMPASVAMEPRERSMPPVIVMSVTGRAIMPSSMMLRSMTLMR
jgi:hypothetical protein